MKINEIKHSNHSLFLLVTIENLVDVKTSIGFDHVSLVDEDGLKCDSDLDNDIPTPYFGVTPNLLIHDKHSGWLSFHFPNSKYSPKKIRFEDYNFEILGEFDLPPMK
jgi:hypothetical protein